MEKKTCLRELGPLNTLDLSVQLLSPEVVFFFFPALSSFSAEGHCNIYVCAGEGIIIMAISPVFCT